LVLVFFVGGGGLGGRDLKKSWRTTRIELCMRSNLDFCINLYENFSCVVREVHEQLENIIISLVGLNSLGLPVSCSCRRKFRSSWSLLFYIVCCNKRIWGLQVLVFYNEMSCIILLYAVWVESRRWSINHCMFEKFWSWVWWFLEDFISIAVC
jgi:hypothetical protein